jgi:kumamolisin
MTSIPGSARILSSGDLASTFEARKVTDGQDDSETVIQVTVVLRSGTDADAVRRENPTMIALREAHRPNQLDVDKVINFARAHNLTIVDPDRPPRMVVLEGTVSNITTAFGTNVNAWEEPWPWPREQYIQPPNPPFFPFRLRPAQELQVPEDLAPIVQGVFGIDNRKEARMHMWAIPMHMWADPMHMWADRMQAHGAPTQTDTVPTQTDTPTEANPGTLPDQPRSYTVAEVADKYNFPAAEGRGQTVAILSLGGCFDREGFTRYYTDLGIPVPEVFEVPVDCEPPQLGKQQNEDFEVALDVHIIASLVPRAKIVIYYVENTSQGFINGLAKAIYNESLPPSVISISWGSFEESWTEQAISAIEDLLRDAKALDITVCCASGDLGAWDGDPDGRFHVDFPASSPHVLSCGGTTLRPEPVEPDQREVVWSEAGAVWNQPKDGSNRSDEYLASGGGQSARPGKPDWQSQSADPQLRELTNRGIPDVAGFADPRNGFTISVSGQEMIVGGTSAAAPLWAGLIARINEILTKNVGYLNSRLYLEVSRDAFLDITEGSNGKWKAEEGWDACTGLGRPCGDVLLRELQRLFDSSTGPGA